MFLGVKTPIFWLIWPKNKLFQNIFKKLLTFTTPYDIFALSLDKSDVEHWKLNRKAKVIKTTSAILTRWLKISLTTIQFSAE